MRIQACPDFRMVTSLLFVLTVITAAPARADCIDYADYLRWSLPSTSRMPAMGAHPAIIGQIATRSYGVSVMGGLACLAGGSSEGLRIAPARCEPSSGVCEAGLGLQETVLLPPSPNPAAGPVRIRFMPHGTSDPLLLVYDAAGRRVHRLPHGDGGEACEVCWDGRDDAGRIAPSGVSFVRAAWGGRCESALFVLLRSQPW